MFICFLYRLLNMAIFITLVKFESAKYNASREYKIKCYHRIIITNTLHKIRLTNILGPTYRKRLSVLIVC